MNGQCKVTAANAAFTATADLPRLANEAALARPLLARWRNYVAGLEANAVPTLVFVYSHLDEVEQAILSSSCDGARAAAAAAVERLRRKAADFDLVRKQHARKMAQQFDDGQPSDKGDGRTICKNLVGTGSRLNTLRVCMAPREWAKLHESGQEATREMQDKRRVNAPF